MQITVLVIVAFLYAITCYLTFDEKVREQWWYFPLGILLGIVCNFLWFWAAKYIGDKEKIYVFSLCWDTTMTLVYYALPIFLFGVRLDRWSVLGVLLMVSGLAIIKMRS